MMYEVEAEGVVDAPAIKVYALSYPTIITVTPASYLPLSPG
jgi:hypothetical protein